MKIVSLKCPECGGEIEYKEGLKVSYCPYCGTKLLFDNETKTININKTIRTEFQDKTKLEEMRLQHEIDEKDYKDVAWMLIGFCVLMLILIMILIYVL